MKIVFQIEESDERKYTLMNQRVYMCLVPYIRPQISTMQGLIVVYFLFFTFCYNDVIVADQF